MSWLWVGGLLVAFGGLAALGPRRTTRSAPNEAIEAAGVEGVTVEAAT
ncbi:MAG: hypothetical protein HY262_11585 [Chloroflexi bacterium]|nr:hypothetical protein [Chloroflexota bacterium]